MAKLKTDWRASLGCDTLSALIRIKEGVPLNNFDATPSVNTFFQGKPRRPNKQSQALADEWSETSNFTDNAKKQILKAVDISVLLTDSH